MNKIFLLSALAVFQISLSDSYSLKNRLLYKHQNTDSIDILYNNKFSDDDKKKCADAFFVSAFGNISTSKFKNIAKKYENSAQFKKKTGYDIENNLAGFASFLKNGNLDLFASIDYIASKYWENNHRLLLFLAICFETCALELACACKDNIKLQQVSKCINEDNKCRNWIISADIVSLTRFIRSKAKRFIAILEKSKFKDRLVKAELDLIKKDLFQKDVSTEKYIQQRIKRITMFLDAYKPYSEKHLCSITGCDTAKSMYGQMLLHDFYRIVLRFINTGKQSGNSSIMEYQAMSDLRTFLVDVVEKQCLTETADESVKNLIANIREKRL